MFFKINKSIVKNEYKRLQAKNDIPIYFIPSPIIILSLKKNKVKIYYFFTFVFCSSISFFISSFASFSKETKSTLPILVLGNVVLKL